MKLIKESILTGKANEMEIPNLSIQQLIGWQRSDIPIQVALPHLTDDEREFVRAGITPEEWEKYMGPEPEEETE